ncbi:hypothetical protein PA08_0693 [Cutibacterium modestum P08]|nr:hypothetical protein PA08_0693 [Cutibacterium modestum P08]
MTRPLALELSGTDDLNFASGADDAEGAITPAQHDDEIV